MPCYGGAEALNQVQEYVLGLIIRILGEYFLKTKEMLNCPKFTYK